MTQQTKKDSSSSSSEANGGSSEAKEDKKLDSEIKTEEHLHQLQGQDDRKRGAGSPESPGMLDVDGRRRRELTGAMPYISLPFKYIPYVRIQHLRQGPCL